jgi:hypothetical protein
MQMTFSRLLLTAVLFAGASASAQYVYPAPVALGTAEIQIFLNYRGPNDYDLKLVSYPERPVSATLLDPSKTPADNGACYMGDPDAALQLWNVMVRMMNIQTRDAVRSFGSVYFDPYIGKPALRLLGVDPYGRVFEWFPRMRECDRWSLPEERLN